MNFQILRGTPRTLELRVFSSGDLTDLDADPTVVLTDGNGIGVTTGTVTKPGSPDATGVYQSTLPAQTDLKVITAVWSGLLNGNTVSFTQIYEVVGNLLFTEAEARVEPIVGQQSALADEDKYTDARIAHWRSVIADMFEHRMGRGVVRRYCRAKFSGGYAPLDLNNGYPVLASGATLNRPGRTWDVSRVLSITHDGVAVDIDDVEVIDYKLYYNTGTWTPSVALESRLNVTVEYEYGPDPVWSEVHQRALDLLLANAAPKGYPSTATSLSNEDGTFRIAVFPTGVEEFFKKHNYRTGL